jgi:hypothetical protein
VPHVKWLTSSSFHVKWLTSSSSHVKWLTFSSHVKWLTSSSSHVKWLTSSSSWTEVAHFLFFSREVAHFLFFSREVAHFLFFLDLDLHRPTEPYPLEPHTRTLIHAPCTHHARTIGLQGRTLWSRTLEGTEPYPLESYEPYAA